uniref:hypothetical protein n=1 Tax=Sphingomonas sp. TaxID=28214 RepID=UPI0025D9AAA7
MNPQPFSDEDLARLLRAVPVKQTSSDLANRIAAAASTMAQHSGARKSPWPRRSISRSASRWIAGVGVNLIAVVAAATSWTGHGFDVRRLRELPARIVAVFHQQPQRTPLIVRDNHLVPRPPRVQTQSSALPPIRPFLPVVSPLLPNPASHYLVQPTRRDVMALPLQHAHAPPAPVWHGSIRGARLLHALPLQAKHPRYHVRFPAKPAAHSIETAPEGRIAGSPTALRAPEPPRLDKPGIRPAQDSVAQRPLLTPEERAVRRQQRRERWIQRNGTAPGSGLPGAAHLGEKDGSARSPGSDGGVQSSNARPDAR